MRDPVMTSTKIPVQAMLPGGSAQQGMSFWELLFLLFVIGFFSLVGIKCFPIYMNQLKVVKAVTGVASMPLDVDNDPASLGRALEKRWDLDDIDYLDWHKVKAVKTVRGHEIAYDYEARQNLFFNIFIVIHFDGSYVMRSAGG